MKIALGRDIYRQPFYDRESYFRISLMILAAVVTSCSELLSSSASACGGEVPISCGASYENEARWLLGQATKAVIKNKEQALTWFTEQSHGYRTMDLYVFCIGPDNIMSAHPDPKLLGTDASKLVDVLGNTFGLTMIRQAKSGDLSDITYMWPKLDQSKPILKHTMYTRVSDQVCAVGYYE